VISGHVLVVEDESWDWKNQIHRTQKRCICDVE